jgi:type IV secretory pathway VirB6-like protein
MNMLRHASVILLLLACFTSFSSPATAQILDIQLDSAFACPAAGGAVTTNLLNNRTNDVTAACATDQNFRAVFAKLFCIFETTLGMIIGNFLCGLVANWAEPFAALMTLYISCLGILFLTGLLNFTLKELALQIFKIALIATFALNVPAIVGIAFSFFINLTVSVTRIFVEAGLPTTAGLFGGTNGGADQIISSDTNANPGIFHTLLRGWEDNPCSGWGMSLILGILMFLPFVFGIVFMAALSFIMVFTRAAFGYLYALTAITFLLAATPIFVSFALFNTTRYIFDRWISYLVSNSVQIIIIYAFLAFSQLYDPFDFLKKLGSLLATYEYTIAIGPSFRIPTGLDICTICKNPNIVTGANGLLEIQAPGCLPGTRDDGIPWSSLPEEEKFIDFLLVNGASLYILMETMDAFLKTAPQMAMSLGGTTYVHVLGGGSAGVRAGSKLSVPGSAAAKAFQEGALIGWQRSGKNSKTLAGKAFYRLAPIRAVSGLWEGTKSSWHGTQITGLERDVLVREKKVSLAMATKKANLQRSRYENTKQLYDHIQSLKEEGKISDAHLDSAKMRYTMAQKNYNTSVFEKKKAEEYWKGSGAFRKNDGHLSDIFNKKHDATDHSPGAAQKQSLWTTYLMRD